MRHFVINQEGDKRWILSPFRSKMQLTLRLWRPGNKKARINAADISRLRCSYGDATAINCWSTGDELVTNWWSTVGQLVIGEVDKVSISTPFLQKVKLSKKLPRHAKKRRTRRPSYPSNFWKLLQTRRCIHQLLFHKCYCVASLIPAWSALQMPFDPLWNRRIWYTIGNGSEKEYK